MKPKGIPIKIAQRRNAGINEKNIGAVSKETRDPVVTSITRNFSVFLFNTSSVKIPVSTNRMIINSQIPKFWGLKA